MPEEKQNSGIPQMPKFNGNRAERRRQEREWRESMGLLRAASHPKVSAKETASAKRKSNIWLELFGLDTLLRFDIFSFVVPGILLAIGFGMLSLDWFPHNLLISQICFGIATAFFITKVITYAARSNHEVADRVIFSVVVNVVILMFACYGISVIQDHKHPAADSLTSKPQTSPSPQKPLRGEILQLDIGSMVTGKDSPSVPMVLAWFTVYNSGPPSVVDKYTLCFTLPNGGLLIGPSVEVNSKWEFQDLKAHISDADKASLAVKTLEQPIPTGGSARGLLAFRFPLGSKPDILQNMKSATIKFEDASGNVYEAQGRGPVLLQRPGSFIGMPNFSKDDGQDAKQR